MKLVAFGEFYLIKGASCRGCVRGDWDATREQYAPCKECENETAGTILAKNSLRGKNLER